MKLFGIVVCLVVVVQAGYHEDVGIPLAAKIKEYEDKLIADEAKMSARTIVSGSKIAPEDAHPYLVGLIINLLGNQRISTCAGALLSINHVVTIAQCVEDASSIEVVAGSQKLFYGGVRFKTEQFKMHPKFDHSRSLDYDIAKLKLPYPAVFPDLIDYIKPAALPQEPEVVGEFGLVSGWGLTNDHQYFVSTNQKVSHVYLKIVEERVCKELFNVTRETGSNVCTSGEGGVGTCRGDAGAPLIIERNQINGNNILIGVSSYSASKCTKGHPSAFSRIYTYKDFLTEY